MVEDLERLSIPPSFRSGQALKDHLAQRVKAFEKIAVPIEAELPNFAAWVIGTVGVLFVFVFIGDFSSASDQAIREPTRFNRTGLICLGLLCAYVLALQFNTPYVVATALAIFLMGGTISQWRSGCLFSIAQIALLVALSTELVFTQVFKIPLP